MRGLAIDMKPVRVNLIAPGAVQTKTLDQVTHMWGEVAVDKIAGDLPLGRIGNPEDLAEHTWIS